MFEALVQWSPQFFTIATAIFIVVAPGFLISNSLGARGFEGFALGILLSFSLIAFASVVFWLIGIPWNLLAVLVIALVLAGIGWALSRWKSNIFKFYPVSSTENRWPFIGVTVAFVLISLSYIWAIPNPHLTSQTYDANFHLNAVQHISHTGNASPFTLLQVSNIQDTLIFQQAGWHQFTALIVPFAGSVMSAANVSTLVISAFVWPVGMIYLSRSILGSGKLVSLFSGLFSAALPSFPLLLVEWGVLYSNHLGTALLPFVIVLLLSIMQFTKMKIAPVPLTVTLLLIGIFGLGIAHPNAVYTLLAIASVLALVPLSRKYMIYKGQRNKRIALLFVALISYGVAAVIWATGLHYSTWGPYDPLAEAVLGSLLNSAPDRQFSFLISMFFLIGVALVAFTRKQRWLLLPLSLFSLIYVVVAWFPLGAGRSALVGIWHGDAQRIAALLPIWVIPIAVVGVLYVIRFSSRKSERMTQFIAVAAVFLAFLATQSFSMQQGRENLMKAYELTDDSYVLSTDEVQVFEYIQNNLEDSDILIGDPWTGASLVYAFTGNRTLFSHVKGSFGNDAYYLAEHLKDGGEEVCLAVKNSGVSFVLDFSGQYIEGSPKPQFIGLRDIDIDTGMFELVFQSGESKLFKIIGCK